MGWSGGDKDLVILFYAYDGEREIPPAPLRRDAHLKKQPELHMTPLPPLTSPCPENWDLWRIKAEYFNLAAEFTCLCQSNYLPLLEKMQLRKQ